MAWSITLVRPSIAWPRKPTVLANLLRGFGTFCAVYGGSKVISIVGTAPLGDVPRDRTEEVKYISMDLVLPNGRHWTVESDPSNWGYWSEPRLRGHDAHQYCGTAAAGGAFNQTNDLSLLPFELSNIKISINQSSHWGDQQISVLGQSEEILGQHFRSGAHAVESGLNWKFEISIWLATVDAVNGQLLNIVPVPWATSEADDSPGEAPSGVPSSQAYLDLFAGHASLPWEKALPPCAFFLHCICIFPIGTNVLIHDYQHSYRKDCE